MEQQPPDDKRPAWEGGTYFPPPSKPNQPPFSSQQGQQPSPFWGNIPPPQQGQPFNPPFSQQDYSQPTQQNYQQFPQQQPRPVPLIRPPKPTTWQRLRSARRSTKFGVGCGVLLLALLLCICPVAAIGAANPQKNVTQAPTATNVPTQTAIPTDTPKPTATAAPTEIPTHVPTTVPTAIPTSVPTQAPVATQAPVPTPKPTQPPGVNGNPWGYNFVPGNLIYNPPAEFCNYFNCIASFWRNTNGYVDECVDGTYSHSGGVTGACSRHGGESKILYSH